MGRLALAAVAVVALAAAVAVAARVVSIRGWGDGTDGEASEGESEAARRPNEARSRSAPGLAAQPAGGGEVLEGDEPGTVHGVVVGPEGEPVEGAELRMFEETVLGHDGSARLVLDGHAEIDARGRFRIASARDGPRWLVVAARRETQAAAVQASVGGPELRIALEPRPVVTVKVLDPDRRPAWRVSVQVRSRRRSPESEQPVGADWTDYLTWDGARVADDATDRAGEVRLEIGPGPYQATVTTPIELRLLSPPPVDFDASTLTVLLESGHTVAGVLRDHEGEPVPSAFVWWRIPDGPWSSERVGADGSFEIEALPQGTIELWADAFGHAPPRGAKALVTPTGSHDVDVPVDLGGELHVRIENWPAGTAGTAVLRDLTEMFGRLSMLPAPVSAKGEVVFRRLQRGHAYALRVDADDGSLAAFRAEVAGQDPPVQPLRLRVSPTGSLRVALEADGPCSVGIVTIAGFDVDWSADEETTPHGIRLDELPSGPLAIEVLARTPDGDPLRGSADVRVPGTVRIKLEAVPESARR